MSSVFNLVKNVNYLAGLSEKEIRQWAAKYDPNEKAANSHGSTSYDIGVGDLFGYRSKRRKAAYEWVKEHDKTNKPNKETHNNPPVVSQEIKPNKIIKNIEGKAKYLEDIANRLTNNKSKDVVKDISKLKNISAELKQLIESVDRSLLSAEEVNRNNEILADIEGFLKLLDFIEPIVQTAAKGVQQPEAAYSMNNGFNINNFVRQSPVIGGNNVVNNTVPKTAFPHQICGLTDQQIVEVVGKHFKVIQELPVYPLYDLLNNKLLGAKMKEFGSKQKSNNPYLTQVNIDEYIDVPELLQKFSLCFTIPCYDKAQTIVVLFNPIPVPDGNGVLNYPLHIFKATKTNTQQ